MVTLVSLIAVLAALQQSPTPPVRTVDKGQTSAIKTPQNVVVRSAVDWSALWRKHEGAGGPPPVDFSREMVVGVFLGTRSTAGYSVEIIRAVGNEGVLTVAYAETSPSRDAVTAQILTAPYHLVAIPKHDGDVIFRKIDR